MATAARIKYPAACSGVFHFGMPYAIATMIAELAILAVWWALKLPLGPGVGMFIH